MAYEYKGYTIGEAANFSLKVIKPIGKGSVHKVLTGLYTSSLEAEKAIDRFLSEKERTNGKTKQSD